MSKTRRIAIIDLGTSSLRLEIHLISSRDTSRLLHRHRDMPRLGEGAFTTHLLNNEAIERSLLSLKKVKELCDEFRVDEIAATGSCVLRDAKNSDDFVRRAASESGIPIRIISGAEEAKLIAKGYMDNETPPDQRYAMVDIGGGSTEINICEGREVLFSYSYALGSNRGQQTFLKSHPPKKRDDVDPITALRQDVRKVLETTALFSFLPVYDLIGTSGTIRTLAKLPATSEKGSTIIERKLLHDLNSRMGTMPLDEIKAIPKMDAKRADLILSGSILFEEILTLLEVDTARISEYSLRHGLLAEQKSTFESK